MNTVEYLDYSPLTGIVFLFMALMGIFIFLLKHNEHKEYCKQSPDKNFFAVHYEVFVTICLVATVLAGLGSVGNLIIHDDNIEKSVENSYNIKVLAHDGSNLPMGQEFSVADLAKNTVYDCNFVANENFKWISHKPQRITGSILCRLAPSGNDNPDKPTAVKLPKK